MSELTQEEVSKTCFVIYESKKKPKKYKKILWYQNVQKFSF